MAETIVDEGRKLKEGERIGFQFFANPATDEIASAQFVSSNSNINNIVSKINNSSSEIRSLILEVTNDVNSFLNLFGQL